MLRCGPVLAAEKADGLRVRMDLPAYWASQTTETGSTIAPSKNRHDLPFHGDVVGARRFRRKLVASFLALSERLPERLRQGLEQVLES